MLKITTNCAMKMSNLIKFKPKISSMIHLISCEELTCGTMYVATKSFLLI